MRNQTRMGHPDRTALTARTRQANAPRFFSQTREEPRARQESRGMVENGGY
jgi:hypothetical protein